jgi:hypothetical protein
MDPAASIGIKLYDGAAKRGAHWNCDPIIHINGIKQAAFQWLPSLHRNMLEQLNRQRSLRRDLGRCRLAQRGTAEQAEQKARRHEPLPTIALDPHLALIMTKWTRKSH